MNKYLSTSSAIRCLMGCVFSLSAQPSGMEVVSGAADLASPQSHLLQIQASDRAIIQWDSFSIGAGEMTRFVLPDAASAVLNRVTGSQMSELMGVLESNGQIFLINPQGVFVGPDATINTASFIASTFDVLNEDFLAKADLLFQGDSMASIVNLGTISTQMGDVILLARYIDNQGSIEAPQGTAALGAGTRVLLKPADSTKIYIETSIATGAQEGVGIHNQGSIQALLVELQADGNPYQHAIRHDGRLDALGVAERNGRILLIADEGQVYITGHSKATAAEQIAPDAGVEAYGEITVCADDIVVTDQASFDVSNELGGGLIRLGFERQEDGLRARGLWTGKEVKFNADAIANGNGGRVLFWGGDAHVFLSNITARGGSVSGNGGFVEISTRGLLVPEGLVNTLAPNGSTGTLLYDPTDITITMNPDNDVLITTIPPTTFYRTSNPGGTMTNIDIIALQLNLAMNNVDISTASSGGFGGDITLGDPGSAMPITWMAATKLTLFANQDILIFNRVRATGDGEIQFTANRDVIFESRAMNGGSSLETSTGDITVLAGRDITMQAPLNGDNFIQADSGNVFVTAANTYDGTSLIRLDGGDMATVFFSAIRTISTGNITVVAAGGGALPFVGGTGALALIAGTTWITQIAEISAQGVGDVTITTGLPVDTFHPLAPTSITHGSVLLRPSGAFLNNSVAIEGRNVTLNILGGNLTIQAGMGTSVPTIAHIASNATSSVTGNVSVFVDGNLDIEAAGANTPISSTNIGIFTKGRNSSFNLVVSGNMTTTSSTGQLQVGNITTGTATLSTTAISVLGNLSMVSGGAVTNDTYNRMLGINGMTLNVGGSATLTTSGATGAGMNNTVTQIGAGSDTSALTRPLNVTIGGNLSMTNTTAGISNGGETQIISFTSDGAHVIGNGSITINGSTSSDFLGRSFIGCSRGPLIVTSAGDIVMTAGTVQADAQIGYPDAGPFMAVPFSYPITVNTNNLILNAGAGVVGSIPVCLIGAGNAASTSVLSGAITVNATGTVTLFGGTSMMDPAISMIGHMGAVGATLSGAIAVNALNVVMKADNAITDSFAQIGHGSTTFSTPAFDPYTITVIADRNIVMTSEGVATTDSTGNAQIWNRCTSPPANAITVICDNASQTAPDYGTGFFSFGSGSILFSGPTIAVMTPGVGEVRIYTSVRIFNTVTAMGTGQYTSVPVNGVTPGSYPSALGLDTLNEIWGVWADPTAAGGGAAYPVPPNGFVIYYKRVGGILISNLPTVGATVGVNTIFTQTEPYIQAANIQSSLGLNVTINAETLPNSAPTNDVLNGNSILWRDVPADLGSASITWGSIRTLTLIAGNDIVVKDATITSTEMMFAQNTINFLAGRDCVIGTGDQFQAARLQITGQHTIHIETGRDLWVNGSGVVPTLSGVGQILNVSGNGNILTVGRDFVMQANQSLVEVQLHSVVLTAGRNFIQNAGSGLAAHTFFQCIDGSTVSLGGYHSLYGGAGGDATSLFNYSPNSAQTLTYTSNGGLYLTGGSGPDAMGSFAFGGGSAVFSVDGPVSAIANINIANGNVIMNGGAGGGAYIQTETSSAMPLTLNVPNGSLILQGNQLGCLNGIATTYRYGSAGIFTTTNSSSPINITVGGDVRLVGGNGPGSVATIGNSLLTGTSGIITVNVAGNLIQQGGGTPVITGLNLGAGAGTGQGAVAQIVTIGNQPIVVQVGGDYWATGGAGYAAAVGIFNTNSQPNPLTVTVGGDMLLVGGSHTGAGAVCDWHHTGSGTGATFTVGNAAAATGDLILRSGKGYQASAFLNLSNAGMVFAAQNVTCYGNLVLTSNSDSPGFSIAAITGGDLVNYTLNIGRDAVITAGGNNPALVGSGDPASVGGYTGSITFNSAHGDLILNGSSLIGETPEAGTAFPLPDFTRGFAQIGHVNGPTASDTISGDITITTVGSVIQNGGKNPGGYAQIGHGGYPKTSGTNVYGPCVLKVFAGRNIHMSTPATTMAVTAPGSAQTVNYATGMGSSITLVTDNTYATAPASGPGSFYFSSGSQILTGDPLTQVPIYTSSRIFNTVGGPINGTSLPLSPLNVTNAYEQWGVYAETGVYPITMPATPFQFYYKRVGGLVISPVLVDNGVNYNDGIYTFFLAEATISSFNLSANLALVSNSVLIDSSGLNATPFGSSTNSIVVTGLVGWGNTNTLTINASQDLVLNNTLTSSSSSFAGDSTGITLNAARNVFIGDGTERAPTGILVQSAPITVTALGSIGLYGGAAENAAVLVNSALAADIRMTASNGLTLRGGGVASTGVRIVQNDGDVILDVLGGDLNVRGGSGSNTLAQILAFPPPFTVIEGDVTVTVSTGSAYLVGGSGSNAYAEIGNTLSDMIHGNLFVSVLQNNLVMQGGSGVGALAGLASAERVRVDVAGDLIMKGGFGGSVVCATDQGEGIYNIGGNILLKAGSGQSGVGVATLGGFPLTVSAGGSIALIAQNNHSAVIGSQIDTPTDNTDITVTACAGIALQGQISGQQSDVFGFAKIGHFTSGAPGMYTLSGNIAVTAGDAVTLKAGSFYAATLAGTIPPSQSTGTIRNTSSAAQIGLGHAYDDPLVLLTASGSTTVNARALTIQAGLGAQGGSASVFASGLLPLTMDLSAGDLYIQSGGSTGSSATASAPGGAVTAKVLGGNILLLAGVGSGVDVDTPNTAALTSGADSLFAACAGSLTITGGIGSNSHASMNLFDFSGTLTVDVGSDVIMTSGFGMNSYANIGCLTSPATSVVPINVVAGGNILLTSAGYGYAKIGHGTVTAPGLSWFSDISVSAGGNIVLSGTGGSNLGTTGGVQIAGGGFGFSQIGHVNSESAVTSIMGDIEVVAGGSLLLNPGLKSTAYARIGHGGVAKLSGMDVYVTGSIRVLCGENVYLLNSGNTILAQAGNTKVWGELAQIVNPCIGPIWIVADQSHPTLPDAGTGHFVFSSNAFVAVTALTVPAQKVKIYTAVRIFNFLPGLSVIDGQSYTPTFLPTSIPAAYANGEAWGYSYETDATNPVSALNFEIYYKRVGGITLSGDFTSAGVTFTGGTFASTAPEVIVDTSNNFFDPNRLDLVLASDDTTINAATLSGTTDANNCILFRRTWTSTGMNESTLSWPTASSLTLLSPQDIAISGSISSIDPSAALILTEGRDILLETCGLSGQITTSGAPVTITAGRDFRSTGPSLGFTTGGQIRSTGGMGSEPITVTAGRDVLMTGGAYVGTAAQYAAPGGNSETIETVGASIFVTATTGTVRMQGGYGSAAGLTAAAPIAVNAAQDIVMQGGSGATHSFVRVETVFEPIVMTAGGNIYMLGGFGLAPAASNVDALIESSGAITIHAGGFLTMAASPSISSQSPGVIIVAHGTQPIVITTVGDLTMTSGPGGGEASIKGDVLPMLIDLSVGGNLTINSANLPLALLLLNQNLSVAHIGGNGLSTNPTILIRNVNGNLTLNGNRNSYATIGGNRASAVQTYSGDITIQNVDGYVTLNAYNGPCNNDYGFVQIGVPNNRTSSASTINSTVTIAAQQDITLNGGSTPSAFARIGNGGQTKPLMSPSDSMQGDVSLFSGYGNLTLNSNTGGADIAAFDTGSITTIIAGNTTLNGSSTITSQTGPITLLTGESQILNDSSSISNASPSGISIVADNLYPTPPDFGLGRILTAFNSSISTPGPLRLYSAAQQINIVSGLINSQRFTPGPLNINSAVEQWFKYYPQFFGGFPYIFFYKTSLQGMILDATVANSTLTQFLPLAVPIIRVETKPVDETKESEET